MPAARRRVVRSVRAIAGDAKRRRIVLSIVRLLRRITQMCDANARFGKKRWREHVIVIEAGTVRRGDSGRFKSAASGAPEKRSEKWGLIGGRVLMAEAPCQMVLLIHRVVRLDVVADGIFTEWKVLRKIVGRRAGNVSR